jgi:hypothetical protein
MRVLSIGTLLPATSSWHPGATWQSWPLLAMIDACSGTAASEVNGSSSEEPVRSDTVTNVLQITVQFTLFLICAAAAVIAAFFVRKARREALSLCPLVERHGLSCLLESPGRSQSSSTRYWSYPPRNGVL